MLDKKDCTILVCSCDSYEDAWYPFFKLLSKFWPGCPYDIILNTESKEYSYSGLNIRCFQKYIGRTVPYGERMIAHIQEIKTPFTIVLMDDFFIRRTVNEEEIEKVINWLKDDIRAVVFSFQSIQDELNTSSDKYPGYNKRPVYGEYKYNFQAAVWKTEYLLRSWKRHETPWEWETLANFRSFNDQYDFYAIQTDENTPIDYGFRNSGMGIYRGKWVVDSVDALFRENGIDIDYAIRGIYSPKDKNTVRMMKANRLTGEIRSMKSIGILAYVSRLPWRLSRQIKKSAGLPVPRDWIEYKREEERKP